MPPANGGSGCLGGLVALLGVQQVDTQRGVTPELRPLSSATDIRVRELVRQALTEEVKAIQESVVQQLRSFEIQASGSLQDQEKQEKSEQSMERLHRKLLHMERRRRRRNLEVSTLRKTLKEVRSIVIDESTPPSASNELEAEQLLAEIRAEREEWWADKRRLKEQIQQLEEESRAQIAAPTQDPEKEKLKRQVKQLQMSIESRDRYACWVCNQQATAREAEETDADSSEVDNKEEDELENLRRQLSGMKSELKKLKGLPSGASTPVSPPTPRCLGPDLSAAITEAPPAAAASTGAAASTAPASATGALKQPDRPKADKPERKGVQFADEQPEPAGAEAPPEVEAPTGEDNTTRVARGRSPTPYSPPQEERSVQFSEVNSTEAIPATNPGPMRPTRGRLATPFVSGNELQDAVLEATRQTVTWSEDPANVEQVPAAAGVPMRTSRDRVATPHVSLEQLEIAVAHAHQAAAAQHVHFTGAAAVEEVVVEGPLRSSRSRTATPYTEPGVVDATDVNRSAVRFSSAVDTEAIPQIGMRSSRERAATPAVPGGGDIQGTQPSFQLSSEPPNIATVQVGFDASMRTIRGRQATPYVANEPEVEPAEGNRKSVQFSDAVSTADVPLVDGMPRRSSRSRVATPFAAPDLPAVEAEAGDRHVEFSGRAPVVEEVRLPPGTAFHAARARAPTPWAPRIESEDAANELSRGGVSPRLQVYNLEQGDRDLLARSVSFQPKHEDVVVEAASTAPEHARPVRSRIPTGFVHADASSDATPGSAGAGVRFAAEEAVAEAASQAPTHPRSLRTRTPTGFVHGDEVGVHDSSSAGPSAPSSSRPETLRFADEPEVAEAASAAPAHPRVLRTRTPTGFIHADVAVGTTASASSGETGAVRFAAQEASVGEAASAAPSNARPVRQRIPTGFVRADDAGEQAASVTFAEDSGGGVRFAPLVSEGEAASSTPERARPVRNRQATGFVHTDEGGTHVNFVEDGADGARGVRFATEATVAQAASAAPAHARSVRQRIPTGFVHEPVNEGGSSVRFAEGAESSTGEAASTAPANARSVRDRTPTGFVHPEEGGERGASVGFAPDDGGDGRGVRFAVEESVAEAASAPPTHPRPVRDRTPTGFVQADAVSVGGGSVSFVEDGSDGRAVRFAAGAAVADAASSAPAHARSAGDRTPTGFVFNDSANGSQGAPDPVEAMGGEGRGVRFAAEASVAEAASALPTNARSARQRTPTGFIHSDLAGEGAGAVSFAEPGADTRGVRFAAEASVEEAASSAPANARSVRQRTPTGFIHSEIVGESSGSVNFAEDGEARGVRFADTPSVAEAASATPSQARPVRHRTPTGFVHADATGENSGAVSFADGSGEGGRGVRFAAEASVAQAASSAPAHARPVRERTPTGFIHSEAVEGGNSVSFTEDSTEGTGVRFAAEASFAQAASSAPAHARPVRERTPTGFIHSEAGEGGNSVSFTEDSTEGRGVRFAAEASFAQAASSAAAHARPVRERTPTGFIHSEAGEGGNSVSFTEDSTEGRGVRFAADATVAVAASSAPAQARPVRERTPTGFIHADTSGEGGSSARFAEDGTGVQFAVEPTVVEAASVAPAHARSVRERTPTGFVHTEVVDDQAHAADGPQSVNVRFAAPNSVAEAASSPAANPKSVRQRTPTAFEHGDTADAGQAGVRFAAADTVLDAASAAPFAARPLRDRAPTGFARSDDDHDDDHEAAPGVRFAAEPSVGDAASAAAPVARSLRNRNLTGFIFDDPESAQQGHAEDAAPNGDAGVRFAAEATVLDAASSGAAHARAVRERIPTGFVHAEGNDADLDGAAPSEGDQGVRFAAEDSVAQSASAAPARAKSVRTRIPTSFIYGSEGSDEPAGGGVRFASEDTIVDAASTAAPTARPPKGRQQTGFVHAGSVDASESGVRFAPEDTIVDAASTAAPTARPPKGRQQTGFVHNDSVDATEDGVRLAPDSTDSAQDAAARGVRFASQDSVAEAASVAATRAKPVRSRIPTGFIHPDELTPVSEMTDNVAAAAFPGADDGGVRFSAEETVLDAASAAPEHAKPIRGRMATGYVSRGVDFALHDAVVDAASEEAADPRSVRQRTPTGYVHADEGGVHFADEVESVGEAASSPPAHARPVRTRHPTGFVRPEALGDDGDSGVRFAAEADVQPTSGVTGATKSVRNRTPTAFVPADQVPANSSVSFAGDAEVVAAASAGATNPRSVRDRAPTGWADEAGALDASEPAELPAVAAKERREVHFASAPSVAEAASAAAPPGASRPVRTRIPTGFVDAEHLPPLGPNGSAASEPHGVRFAEERLEDVGEAASSSAGAEVKPLRQRTPTGFAFQDVDSEEATGSRLVSFRRQDSIKTIEGRDEEPSSVLRFSAEVEVCDAASSPPAGEAKNVRTRTPTGYSGPDSLDAGDGSGVRFDDHVQVGSAASSAPAAGVAKQVRTRTPTGFVSAEDMEVDGGADTASGVRFSAEVEVEDAASAAAAAGEAKHVRGRTPTGFISAEEAGALDTSVTFSHSVVEGDAASLAAPAGEAKDPRSRTPTGFAAAEEAPAIVKFDSNASVGEAASVATPDPKPCRTRHPTGYVSQDAVDDLDEAGGVRFAIPAGVPDEPARSSGKLRARQATGFVHSEDLPKEESPVAGTSTASTTASHVDVPPLDFKIRFAEDVSVSEEPVEPGGELRPVRSRTPTGYFGEDAQELLQDLPVNEGVNFREDSPVSAVSAAGEMKSTRTRTPTGWHSSEELPADERCVRFNEALREELSARTFEREEDADHETSPANVRNADDPPSDAETVSSCSSRNPRSRMNTPFMGPEHFGAGDMTGTGSMQMDDFRSSSRRSTRTRSMESGILRGAVSCTSDRESIKSAALTSNAEREIFSRVQRNAQRQAREDRECIAFAGFVPSSGRLGSLPMVERELSMDVVRDHASYLAAHLVEDAVKDTDMLRTSLRDLTFFEEFDDDAMYDLINAMEVYEFADQDKAVRQGDTDGTHFFVVAEGEFTVVKNSEPVVNLGPGRCFGESVLVLFGERNATVVSKGRSRAYGMEGLAVREILREQYEQKRATVVEMVDEVLSSNACDMLSTLNAYQLQSLYDQVDLRLHNEGDVLIREGAGQGEEMLILFEGDVRLTEKGRDLGLLARFGVSGDRLLVFQESPLTLTAETAAKTLVLSRRLLETIFGDQLEQVLVRNRILWVLSQHAVFSRLHEEQREAVASSCVIREIQPGQELTGAQICEGCSVAEHFGLPNFEADYWLRKDDMRLALRMQLEPSQLSNLVLELKCAQDLLNLFSLYHSTHPHATTPVERQQQWENTKYRMDSDHERFYKVIKRMMEHRIPKAAIYSIAEIRTEMDECMREIFHEWLGICIARVEKELEGEVFTSLTEDVPAGSDELPIMSVRGFSIGDKVEVSAGEISETRTIMDFGSLILDAPLVNAYPGGAKVTCNKKVSGSPRRPSKSSALENFERFHNMPQGSATVDQVAISSAGISGWSSTTPEVEVYLDHCYFYNLEVRGLEPKCRYQEQCRKVHARMPDNIFELMAAPKRARDLRFAIVLHGEVETRLVDDDRPQPEATHHSGGDPSRSTIGEETLLHRDRRWNRYVKAITKTSTVKLAIWRSQELDSVLTFDNLDFALEQEDKMRVLKTIFIFQTLAKSQLGRLASALETKRFAPGERVFSQGDVGKDFFIIRRGLVNVDINGRRIRGLGMGDYFGERALLGNERRTADITACEQSELWKMNKDTFQEIMQGPCLDYLTARIALQDTKLEFKDLEFMRVIGRGGFGVVKMVKARRTNVRYALKCVRKRVVVEQRGQDALASERSILAEVDHPFMVKFVRSFKSETRVYFLMELISGGELLDALDKMGFLNHSQAMFYTGSIVLALEFLHARRIAYLDLKSENCLIDGQGYLKLIDFGIAQRITASRCHVMKGTPVFMAPEMILGKGYTTVADLWSLGICLYDFVIGQFPFANGISNYGEIFNQVLQAELEFPKWYEEKEPRWEATVSLIRGLLNRDPVKRLGAGFEGFTTLREHAFFRGFCWDQLLGRELQPPYLPTSETYAEDKEMPQQGSASQFQPLEEVEAEIDPRDEGWEDPDPGWDADF